MPRTINTVKPRWYGWNVECSRKKALKMASGQDKEQLEDLPALFRSAVWEHYGFSFTYDNDEQCVRWQHKDERAG